MVKVYFAPLQDDPSIAEQVAAIERLIVATNLTSIIDPNDYVAVKLHVGEKNNTTHVKPELIKALVESCQRKSSNVFLTETSTLYKGERENAVKHIMHAHNHGFGIEAVGAPFIMADGLTGSAEVEVQVDGGLEQTVKIAREIAVADVLIAVSHPTGHVNAGLGACLKNLGMGLASRAGKLRQHSSIFPEVGRQKCRFCRKCLKWCPAEAIIETSRKALIIKDKCIGCGECLTVCRYDAIKYDWGMESGPLQQRMVEHAAGALKGKEGKSYFINVLVGMTQDCDCYSTDQPKFIPDIGILAAADPVAVDKATLDLTEKMHGQSLAALAYQNLNANTQLEHAVKMRMGSTSYELVTI